MSTVKQQLREMFLKEGKKSLFYMCRPYLFHDTTSGDEDSNVRKFSAKFQLLGLFKHAIIPSWHNRLTL